MGGSQLLLFWSRQDVIPPSPVYDIYRIDQNKNIFNGLITKTSDGITTHNNKTDGDFIELQVPIVEELVSPTLPTIVNLVSFIDDTDPFTPEIDPKTKQFLQYIEQLSTRLFRQ